MRYRTTVVAVLAAAAGLTSACGTAAPSAPSATHPASAIAAVSPPSCKQQYTAWKNGPARAQAKKMAAELNAVQSAATSEDLVLMTSALQSAGASAVRLARYPMPACADPHGYWSAILARIQAAGDNAGSSSGLSALLLAEAPLKDVPGMESKLTAELKRNHLI